MTWPVYSLALPASVVGVAGVSLFWPQGMRGLRWLATGMALIVTGIVAGGLWNLFRNPFDPLLIVLVAGHMVLGACVALLFDASTLVQRRFRAGRRDDGDGQCVVQESDPVRSP